MSVFHDKFIIIIVSVQIMFPYFHNVLYPIISSFVSIFNTIQQILGEYRNLYILTVPLGDFSRGGGGGGGAIVAIAPVGPGSIRTGGDQLVVFLIRLPGKSNESLTYRGHAYSKTEGRFFK